MDPTDITKYLPAFLILVSAFISIFKKDKKDNTWINVLKNDKSIKSCIQKYNEIENPEGTWVTYARFLPIILSSVIFLLDIVFRSFFNNTIIIILFFITICIAFRIIQIIKDISLLKELKQLATRIGGYFRVSKSIIFRIQQIKEDKSKLKELKQLAILIIFVNNFLFYSTIFTMLGFYAFYSTSHQELFIWNEIPGSDNAKLISFLNQTYNSDWIKTAEIERIDEKTIKVFNGTNLILLRLNDDRTIVNLTINDGRFEEFDVQKGNHKISIYSQLSITQYLYNNIVFLFNWILLLTGTIYLSFMSRKNLLLHSKFLLNKKYRVNFPYVYIKTNSVELKSKVWDIFDKNLIILENYNVAVIKAVKWDSIKCLELIRFNRVD